jgi:hypothetical protein
MTYHILLSRPFDLTQFHLNAQIGKSPRHTMWDLSQTLNATVHQPDQQLIRPIDRLAAQLIGNLVRQLDQNDTVFCTCESVGLPLAILASRQANRPKLAVYVMRPENLRVRATSQLLGLAGAIDLFLTNTQIKAETPCARICACLLIGCMLCANRPTRNSSHQEPRRLPKPARFWQVLA